MKKSLFRQVYKRWPLLSTDALEANRHGFLMIELMITLVGVLTLFLVIGQLYSAFLGQYRDVQLLITATNYASAFLETGIRPEGAHEEYHIETVYKPAIVGLYQDRTITVSWKTNRGIVQSMTMHGGGLYAPKQS